MCACVHCFVQSVYSLFMDNLGEEEKEVNNEYVNLSFFFLVQYIRIENKRNMEKPLIT